MTTKTGILLVNLGTPAAPTTAAVKAFLSQFLHDQRVVDLPRYLWCPLLHFIILPTRSPRVAKLYQQVWTEQGSPLALSACPLPVHIIVEPPSIERPTGV